MIFLEQVGLEKIIEQNKCEKYVLLLNFIQGFDNDNYKI